MTESTDKMPGAQSNWPCECPCEWGEHFNIATCDDLQLAGRFLNGQVTTRSTIQVPGSNASLNAASPPMVAIIVHGLGEHSGRYATVANRIAEMGIHVVAYDHRGHGKSPGKRGGLSNQNDLIDDLSEAIRTVRKKHSGASICLVGHSMGGIVVARYIDRQIRERQSACGQKSTAVANITPGRLSALTKTPPNSKVESKDEGSEVELCIMSSPALGLHLNSFQKLLLSTLGVFLPKVTVGNGLKPKWISSDPAVVDDYIHDPLVHRRVSGELVRFMLQSISLVQANASNWDIPTLLMYATKDRCVNPAGAASFSKLAPHSIVEAHPLNTASHEVFSERDGHALQLLSSWLTKALAARP